MSTLLPESISDEECPICLSVLLKPVTLACKHELCMSCLSDVLQRFTTCPICSRKLGSEFTPSTDLSLYVNHKRWDEIQTRYPERVKLRSNNLDTDSETDNFEFAISQSKLHFEQEQKKRNDNQAELSTEETKPEKKETKHKRGARASPTTTKAKVTKPPAKPRAVKPPPKPKAAKPKPKAVKASPEPIATTTRVLRSSGKVGSKPTDPQ